MKRVNISQVDALFSAGLYPIEFLFYYREGLDTKRIRTSLKKLSSIFWPVFGQYRDGVIQFERYREEYCYDEETADRNFDIPETEEDRFERYRSYIQPDLERLFFLKIIRFRNGLILIPKLYHLAGDGYSYFYFLSVLARLSQGSPVPLKSTLMKYLLRPHHRRTVLREFSFEGIELPPPRQEGQFTIDVKEIPKKDVRSSIREVASSHEEKVSTNDILSALALKNIAGLRHDLLGDRVSLSIPIDIRRQIKEYGRRFFGNGIMLHSLDLAKDYVRNVHMKEIAIEIRKSMPSITKESYQNYLAGLEKRISEGDLDQFRPFNPENGCLVTNISRLPADKLDFGSVRPELIFPLTIEANSAAILSDKDNYVLRMIT